MTAKNEWGLTPQQEKFAQAVASGNSLSDAYRTSYKAGKMKQETIQECASRLASDRKISARVKSLQAAAAEIAVDEAVEIARENLRLSKSRISGIMHPDGRVKLPHELDPETEAAIASFKIDEYGRIEYKFWDKNSALERASKILGLFEKDNKQKADPLAALLKELGGNVVSPGSGKVIGPAVEEAGD